MTHNYRAFSWTPHLVQDIWAAMLENKEWRMELHKKNTTLTAENYGIITRFMQKRRISYYEMYVIFSGKKGSLRPSFSDRLYAGMLAYIFGRTVDAFLSQLSNATRLIWVTYE